MKIVSEEIFIPEIIYKTLKIKTLENPWFY